MSERENFKKTKVYHSKLTILLKSAVRSPTKHIIHDELLLARWACKKLPLRVEPGYDHQTAD
jgi:hypothetical protein